MFYLLLLVLAAFSSLILAVHAWLHRQVPGARPLAWLMVTAAIWSLAYALELAAPDLAGKIFWAKIEYVGIAPLPLAWLAFAVQYTTHDHWLPARRMALLGIIPLATILLIFTNEAHGLIWTHFRPEATYLEPLIIDLRGAGFWIYTTYAYLLLGSGTALLVAMLARSRGVYRAQGVVILIGVLAPWVGNVLYLAGATRIDLTPIAFALTGSALTWAVFQYRLLDLVPVAQHVIMESMPDGLLVIDQQARIVALNPAAEQIFHVTASNVIGQPLDAVAIETPHLLEQARQQVQMVTLGERDYELRLTTLPPQRDKPTGHVLLMHDITARHRAEQALTRSQAHLAGIFNSAQDAIITLDVRQCITRFNAAAERMFVCEANTLIGQPIERLIPDPRYDRGRRANGEEFPIESSVSYASVDGEEFVIIILRDITRRKRVERELHAQRQLLENLVAVARATSEQPALEPTLHNVLEVGVSLTTAERGNLFLLDSLGGITQTISVGETLAPIERRAATPERGPGLIDWVVAHQQLALVADTLQDDRWQGAVAADPFTRSALAIPISRGSVLRGVLVLVHSRPQHFTAEHAQLMQAAADQIALAIQNAQAYSALRRMVDRQTTLYEVLRAVGSQLDPEAVAQVAVEQITHLTGWRNIALATLSEDQQALIIHAAGGALVRSLELILDRGRGILGRAFATGRTQCIPDVSRDPDYIQIDPATRSELAVLLRRGGRARGVLNIESDQLAGFDTYDISLAESLADAVALALDNAELYRAISEEHSLLQAMIASSRDGIALLGIDRRILVSNALILELLGLSGQPQDWTGRPFVEALSELHTIAPLVARTLLDEAQRIQQGNEPLGEGEFEIEARTIHWLSLPVLLGASVLGRLMVMRDVTAERQLEQTRNDLTRMLVHDLRNPLGAILSAFELLNMDPQYPLVDAQREIVDIGRHATDRMMNMVNAILDVSLLRYTISERSVAQWADQDQPCGFGAHRLD